MKHFNKIDSYSWDADISMRTLNWTTSSTIISDNMFIYYTNKTLCRNCYLKSKINKEILFNFTILLK